MILGCGPTTDWDEKGRPWAASEATNPDKREERPMSTITTEVANQNGQAVNGPVFAVETITPRIAHLMLGFNIDNRNVRPKHVAVLADDMKQGRWRMTGEAVKIDSAGTLIDGQHRLLACIEADVPFVTLVARGLESEVRVALDTGAKRSLADHLRWKGETNVNALSAAINMGWKWDRGAIQSTDKPSIQTALAWLDANPHVRQALNIGYSLTTRPLRLPPSAVGAVLARALIVDAETAQQFAQAVASDTELKAGDPVLALRRWAIKAVAELGVVKGWVPAGLMVKTWNAYVLGSTVKNLSLRTRGENAEAFPRMLGLDGLPHPFPDLPPDLKAKFKR